MGSFLKQLGGPVVISAEPEQPTISFREFTDDDFPLMLDWLQRPHVKKWWDDGDDTLGKVRGSFSTEDWLGRYIMQMDEMDAGYFQYEIETPGLISIDQFIADERNLDRGVGTRSVQAFIQMIARLERVETVQLDPDPRNGRAIRCYEKVGFRHTVTKPGWEGAMAYFMVLDYRDRSD